MIVTAGKINVSVYFYIVQDASATSPGEPITGLVYSDIETGGSASYMRQGAARVDLTLITLANAAVAHADGGFILVDDTNMPGVYRCDYPDAAFAAGVDQVILDLVVAASNNAVVAPIMVEITTVDLRVVGGMIEADAQEWNGVAITTALETASDFVDEWETQSQADPTGFHVNVREVGDTAQSAGDIIARLPATLVGGAMNSDISAIQANAITAAAIASAALTATKFGANAIDAAALATDAVAEITDGVLDELLAGHTTADSLGEVLNDWQNGGRLDTLLDAIPTTPMRGTDNAALASIATEARLAELDAANLPADLDLVLADSNELQTDWVDGGRLDLILDIIAADTTTDLPALINGLNNISQANVLTQVNAALDTSISELGVGTPTASPTMRTAMIFLYMALRNRRLTDANQDDIHNDAGTVICSAVLSDDTIELIKAEYI